MGISEEKMKIVINNYFKSECDVNTSIREAFEKGFRIGVKKGLAQSKADTPQTDTEIAKAIVHKMIDDAVIAEDAYPDLRQRMHDAVDNYEPQTERSE